MATKTETTQGVFMTPAHYTRQLWLVTIGGYVKAYEEACDHFEKAKEQAKNLGTRRDVLLEELVGKGEDVVTRTEENLKEVRNAILALAEPRFEKIRALFPGVAGIANEESEKADKISELEAEIEKLNQKVAALIEKAEMADAVPAKTVASTAKTSSRVGKKNTVATAKTAA